MILHSYPWYIKDWLLSEARLTMTLEERGLYRDLLDHFFDQGSLPANEAALLRMAACDAKEFRRAWPAVRPKFEERDGRLYNQKAAEILATKMARKEKNAAAGRSGGLAKAKNEASKILANATPDASNCQENATPESSNSSHGRARSPSPTPTNPYSPLLQDSECEAIFHRIVSRHAENYRHPMKMQMIVSAWSDVIGKRPEAPLAQAHIIDQAHAAACSTDAWRGKFRESLDKWLTRCGYMDNYPEPDDDGIVSAKEYLAREAMSHAQGD